MNLRKTMKLKLFYFLGAVIVVSACGESTEQGASQVMISGVQLKKMALERCGSKIKEEVGRNVYAPTETTGVASKSLGDASTTLVLKWKGDKDDFKTAVCAYSMENGLTSLVIDDRTVIEKSF